MTVRWLLALGSTSTILFAIAVSPAVAKGGGEARLDRAIPDDARPGSRITVGWSLGFPDGDGGWSPFSALGVFVRLKAPGGGSEEAYGTEDWTGHFVTDVTVPAGGIAGVEIGVAGYACADGSCWRSDWLFPVTGVGPPKGAVPVTDVYEPRIDPLPVSIPAGEPVRVGVWFVRRHGVTEVAAPARVFVRATDLGTGRVVDVAARPDRPGHFVAMVTFAAPGRYALEGAVGNGDAVEDVVEASRVELEVPAAARPPARAASPAPVSAMSDWQRAVPGLDGELGAIVLVTGLLALLWAARLLSRRAGVPGPPRRTTAARR